MADTAQKWTRIPSQWMERQPVNYKGYQIPNVRAHSRPNDSPYGWNMINGWKHAELSK